MNIKLKSKCLKSYYIKECINISCTNLICGILIFLIMCIVIIKFFFVDKYPLLVIGAMISTHIVCALYVIIDYYFIIRKMKCKKLVLSKKGKSYNCLFKLGMCLYVIALIIISLILFNKNNIRDIYTEYTWATVIPLFILAYIKGYYFSSIIMIGDKSYTSGTYEIKYNDVISIEIIKEYSSISGCIYMVLLRGNSKILGFDKLFKDEFFEIKNKIRKSNNIYY